MKHSTCTATDEARKARIRDYLRPAPTIVLDFNGPVASADVQSVPVTAVDVQRRPLVPGPKATALLTFLGKANR